MCSGWKMFKDVRIIDLTHSLKEGIPFWKGGCGYKQNEIISCIDSLHFKIQDVEMDLGIGTHMDSPAHCIKDGKTIGEIPLEKIITECVVINVSMQAHESYSITLKDVEEFENKYTKIKPLSFVIFYTGWERYWNNPSAYCNKYIFPSVHKDVAKYLVDKGVAGIGIDTLSPDRPADGFPVHEIILGAGKYIIENIANANKLPHCGSYLMALPLKLSHGTESPVRLIGIVKKRI